MGAVGTLELVDTDLDVILESWIEDRCEASHFSKDNSLCTLVPVATQTDCGWLEPHKVCEAHTKFIKLFSQLGYLCMDCMEPLADCVKLHALDNR